MRNSMKVFVSGSFMAFCLTLPLAAGPITYTMTGDLSGTLDGTPFLDKAFTFVLDGNTADITTFASVVLVDEASSTSISIAGFTTADFTEPVEAAVDPLVGVAGIINLPDTAGITIGNTGFEPWNLATSLGPLEETGAPFAAVGTFTTSLGTLVISGAENVSFSASTAAVPEPASVGLVALSLLGIALRRRWARG